MAIFVISIVYSDIISIAVIIDTKPKLRSRYAQNENINNTVEVYFEVIIAET